MPTETRPITASEQSAPLDRAYLRSPALPSRCGPVEAVPVSACSPISRQAARRLANRARNEAVDARFRFGVDSGEFRTLSTIANEALDLFLATDEDEEIDEEASSYVGSETWAENWIDHCERIGVKP